MHFQNDLFIGLDSDIHRNERLDEGNDEQKRGKERETVEDMTKDVGHDGESDPLRQPGSPQPPEGMDDSGRWIKDDFKILQEREITHCYLTCILSLQHITGNFMARGVYLNKLCT